MLKQRHQDVYQAYSGVRVRNRLRNCGPCCILRQSGISGARVYGSGAGIANSADVDLIHLARFVLGVETVLPIVCCIGETLSDMCATKRVCAAGL